MRKQKQMNHFDNTIKCQRWGRIYTCCLRPIVCCLFFTFFTSGCTYITSTGNIIDPNASSSKMTLKYPYKFYISSIQCSYTMVNSFGTSISKTTEMDRERFATEMRRIFASRYPQLFTADQAKKAIPIDCTITQKVYSNFFSEIIVTPFSLISICTLGLIPAMMNNSYSDIDVQVNAGTMKHHYQHKINSRNRFSIGPLGALETRKSLPDLSKSDTPPFNLMIISAFVLNLNVTPECSDDFIKMFIYAINGLDHKKLQVMYNEKYYPKVDFILP